MSGIALHSKAFASEAARVAVSLRRSDFPACADNSLALYEADRAAHEEAVQNGGVCPCRVPGLAMAHPFFLFLSSSCTGTGFPTRRQASI